MGLLTGCIYFLFTGSILDKLKILWASTFFKLILCFYLLHVVGLLWSDNLSLGLNDIRQKSSMLIIPMILFSSANFTSKTLPTFKVLLLATLFISSLINILGFHVFYEELGLKDIRNMSLFIGHIRYSLVISLGAAWCFFELSKKSTYRFSYLLLLLWFVFYTLESQVFSGLIALLIGILTIILWRVIQHKKWKMLIGISSVSCFLFLSVLIYLSTPIETPKKVIALNAQTQKAWSEKSSMDLTLEDQKGNTLRYTLNRYLYSKNYPLDENGIQKLSKYDVQNIEKGIADIRSAQWGPIARLFEIRYEIQVENDPNLHPIIERLELWQNAWYTIQKNWIIGVGNGDVQSELDQSYESRNSALTAERRLHPHNTFLTYWLTFGIVGIIFVVFLFYFTIRIFIYRESVMGLVFLFILLSSFLYEDTLDSQAGVTFFALFYAFFGKLSELKNSNQ